MRKKSTNPSAAQGQQASSPRASSPSPPLFDVSGVDAVPLRMLVPGLPPNFEMPPDTPEGRNSPAEPEKTHSSPVEIDSGSSDGAVDKMPPMKTKAGSTTLKSRLRRPTMEATTSQTKKKSKSPARKKKTETKAKELGVSSGKKETDKVDKDTEKVTKKRKEKQVQFDENPRKKPTPAVQEKKTPQKGSSATKVGAQKSTQKPTESAPSSSSSRRKFSAKEKGKTKVVDEELVEEFADEENNINVREIWIERGFKDALPDLPGFVAIPINRFEWEFFCSIQIPVNVQWVREFYENLEDVGEGRGAVSNVRGKECGQSSIKGDILG